MNQNEIISNYAKEELKRVEKTLDYGKRLTEIEKDPFKQKELFKKEELSNKNLIEKKSQNYNE